MGQHEAKDIFFHQAIVIREILCCAQNSLSLCFFTTSCVHSGLTPLSLKHWSIARALRVSYESNRDSLHNDIYPFLMRTCVPRVSDMINYMFWPQCSNGEQLSLQQKKIQDSMSVPSSGEQLSVQQETRLYISSDFLLDGCNHNTLCVIMITTAIMERVGYEMTKVY